MESHATILSDLLPALEDRAPFTTGQAKVFAEDAVAAGEEAAEEEEFDNGNKSEGPERIFHGTKKTKKERKLRKIRVNLPISTLVHPRSVFEGFVPPAPLATEREAIQVLLRTGLSQEDGDFIEFELEDFSCYIHSRNSTIPFEMRALHMHACKSGEQHFYFDGILKVGATRYYVHQVIFEEIPLGNYGKDHVTVDDQLWIRSKLNQHKPIYYQLKKPSVEYARFHNDFLWVADLAKHVVDFCELLIENQRNVSIHHFKDDFAKWLKRTYKTCPVFLNWYKQRGSDDFRQSLVANHLFIRKEVRGMLKPSEFDRLQVFREMGMPFRTYKRIGQDPAKAKKHHPVPFTIVTPYIYKCFSHMGLDQLLRPVTPSVSTEESTKLSWPQNNLEKLRFTRTRPVFDSRNAMIERIKPGHLISTPPDAQGTGTKWRTERPDKKWYGLVQQVHTTKKGERKFDVTWLYQPDDTPCCTAKYPWDNELFLSNHCTCSQGVAAKVDEDEVFDVHSVEWFGTPDTTAEFFVRQTYTTEERRFVTLETAHLWCNHNEEPRSKYNVGDTVLVLSDGKGVEKLQAFELLEYTKLDKTVRLRRLRRRKEFDSNCPPNELVYTDEESYSLVDRIMTSCIIRFYSSGQFIPAPYNRGGAGNAFYITHRLLDDGSIQPFGQTDRPQMRQGFDPLNKREKKLRSLDLFCGCGNFGRGVEDGGAVAAKWANDIKSVAIHTYMANTDSRSCHPFLGSIDDLLYRSMQGKFSDSVPRPGEVDVILGGSPCQGFSILTLEKTTLQQQKNRSLIASFAACIDHWRPPWGILENVTTMVKNSMKHRDTEDFFSQLICALIGMGYQAQIILGDAWSHGQPQRRARVFLYFAAPGVRLPQPPYPSHSTPDNVRTHGLGMMTNGEAYVERVLDQPTAFQFVSAGEATADLPVIYDAKTDTCIPFPDHRSSISIPSGNMNSGGNGDRGKNKRTQFLNIPITPYGVNFATAYYTPRTPEGEPDMFEHERDAFPSARAARCQPTSNGWGRAHPRQLFHTITTVCHPTDARVGGKSLHWEQPRNLTIMEVRRAQGIPDEEVLLGTPKEQWAMVGNGVARGISMALGLSLREAWLGTLYEHGSEGSRLSAAAAVADQSNHGLDIPWPAQVDHQDTVEHDANKDEDEEVVLLLSVPTTTAASRNATSSPAASESGTRLHSPTPATSLAGTHRDEFNIKGKRSLSKLLAEGSVSCTAFKRPKVAARSVAAQRLLYEEGLAQLAQTTTEPLLEEEEDDKVVALESRSSTELEEEEQQIGSVERDVAWPASQPQPDDIPLLSASGFTVVRMSSEDLL